MGREYPPYYITAYGLAVKHGFKGTEVEWLNSLGRFHELDLTEAVTVDSGSTAEKFTDITDAVDAEALAEALEAGKLIAVRFKAYNKTSSLIEVVDDSEVYVHLDSVRMPQNVDSGAVYLLGGVYFNAAPMVCRAGYIYLRVLVGSSGTKVYMYHTADPTGDKLLYKLDLTEVVTADGWTSKAESFDITEAVDADAIVAAVKAGKIIEVRFGSQVSIGVTVDDSVKRVLLTGVQIPQNLDYDLYLLGGVYNNTTSLINRPAYIYLRIEVKSSGTNVTLTHTADPMANYVKASGWDANMYLGTDEGGNVVAVEKPEAVVQTVNGIAPDEAGNVEIEIPEGTGLTEEQAAKLEAITVTEDGYTDISGVRKATDISAVRDGQTITITTTLQGDVTHTDVIGLDDNDYPVTIVSDGVACSVTWEGF